MARRFNRRDAAGDLGRLPVFAGCTGRTLKRLSRLGTRMSVHGGQRLITAGTRGAQVVIVVSGVAACLVSGVEEARFGPGDFFGEVATLDGGARTATVVAATDMEVLVLTGPEFDTVVKSSPEVAHRILTAMARRLRQAGTASVA